MNIEKVVTKEIVNQADQATTHIIVHDFIEADDAIFCDLIIKGDGADIPDIKIASGRVFSFGTFPCEDLTNEEKDTLHDVVAIDAVN